MELAAWVFSLGKGRDSPTALDEGNWVEPSLSGALARHFLHRVDFFECLHVDPGVLATEYQSMRA
jgi:hypothetical protein